MKYTIVILITLIIFLLIILLFKKKEAFSIDPCLTVQTEEDCAKLSQCEYKTSSDIKSPICKHNEDDIPCNYFKAGESCDENERCETVSESGSDICAEKMPPTFTSPCFDIPVESSDLTTCDTTEGCQHFKTETNDYFCAPKLRCDDDGRVMKIKDGYLSCEKCPKGTYKDPNIVNKCSKCPFNHYSDEGASVCTPKTNCDFETQYIESKLDTSENIPLSLKDRKDIIKKEANFIQDEFDFTQDRKCEPLSKCEKDQFLTNKYDKISNTEEITFFNNYMPPLRVDFSGEGDQLEDVNNRYYHCLSKQTQPDCNGESICEWEVDTSKCGLKGTRRKRFYNYACSDFQKCENDTYISNYQIMKDNMFDGMYTHDISCNNSKICIPGEYESTKRVTDEFPIITNSSGDAMFTQDRTCITCPVNHYSIEPNVTNCIQQPFAGIGYGTKNYNRDLFESKTNELTIEKCNKKYIHGNVVQFYQDESQTREPCIEQEFTCKKGKSPLFDSKYISRDDIDCNLETNPDALSQCKLAECAAKKKIDSMLLVGERKK